MGSAASLLSGLRQRDNDRVFPRQRSVPVWPTSRLLPVDGSRRWFAVGSPLPFCFQEMHQYTIYAPSPPLFFYQVTVNHHRGCFVRVPSEHIAIIVVVDLASIQSQFDSSSSSATTIADDGHRPIHLIASNPTGVTAIGPALRTVATGPSSCKALACCLQGLGLLHRKLASKAVGCRHDASW